MIANSGDEVVAAGGTAVDTLVLLGGTTPSLGGNAFGTEVAPGGLQIVSAGGAYKTIVADGGDQIVGGGGDQAFIKTGSVNVYESGVASGTIVSSGGGAFVLSGGYAYGTDIQSGGLEEVLSGGSAISTTIESGGLLVVMNGGSATGVNDRSGGYISGNAVVLETPTGLSGLGNKVSGQVVSHGSSLYVLSGGGAYGDVLRGGTEELVGSIAEIYDGTENVALFFGGAASRTIVSSGGEQIIRGGVATGTIVSSGGRQVVYEGTAKIASLVYIPSSVSAGIAVSTTVVAGGVPIELLVNGHSVVQVQCPHVEYWHVELDAHDVIFAEGLAAESYLDTRNRHAFANAGAFIAAHPDSRPRHWAETCLPLVSGGAIRSGGAQRAGATIGARRSRTTAGCGVGHAPPQTPGTRAEAASAE